MPICVVLAIGTGILAFEPLAGFASQVISASVSEPLPPSPKLAPVTALDTSLVREVMPLQGVALNLAHVQSVAVSPNRQVFAAGTADGTIRVGSLRAETSAATRTLKGVSEPVHCLAFSPDGTTLAVGTRDGRVSLWRVADGTLLYTFKKHFQSVSAVAFSPDGQLLASASTDDTIRVWRLSDRTLRLDQEGYSERSSGLTKDARSLTFSPDSQALLMGFANGVIELRSLRDGSVLRTFEGHTSYVYSLDFAPDGRTFASGANDVRIWRLRDGQLLRRIDAHTDGVTSVAFSPDGRILASGSFDTTAKLWSARDGTLQYVLAYDDPVRMIAFGADGRSLAAGGGDLALAVWRLEQALR
jgi:WD40 repeat protein